MLVVGNFFVALGYILHYMLQIYIWIIIISALISWVSPDPYNPIVQFLYKATEPVLSPIRRHIMRYIPITGIDISPIIAILVIIFLDMFLANSLMEIGYGLR